MSLQLRYRLGQQDGRGGIMSGPNGLDRTEYVIDVEAKTGSEKGRYHVVSDSPSAAEAAAKYTFWHEYDIPADECEATIVAQSRALGDL